MRLFISLVIHAFQENYLVITTQKMTQVTSHYGPQNEQNDQSMTRFSGKLSGHYVPKNDQNDQLMKDNEWS